MGRSGRSGVTPVFFVVIVGFLKTITGLVNLVPVIPVVLVPVVLEVPVLEVVPIVLALSSLVATLTLALSFILTLVFELILEPSILVLGKGFKKAKVAETESVDIESRGGSVAVGKFVSVREDDRIGIGGGRGGISDKSFFDGGVNGVSVENFLCWD